MSETTVKRLQVTFNTGRPLGVHASFKHDGEIWIAYPPSKHQSLLAVADRMLGIFSMIRKDMMRWINQWPDDAVRVLAVLDRVERGKLLALEVIDEKTEARTG